MTYLGRRIGIVKVKEGGDEGEVFELRFEDRDNADRPGYTHSSRYLNEKQLREALTNVGATPADLERILTEARSNFRTSPSA